MREAVPGPAVVSSEPGVFSIGQHVNNRVVGATSAELDKIRHDMNSMQVRFNNMSATDTRDKLPKKPWKPEVTPPRRRGGSNRGKGRHGFSSSRRDDQRRNSIANGQNTQNNEQRFKNNGFKAEDNSERVLEANLEVKAEDEEGLIKAQMLNVLE